MSDDPTALTPHRPVLLDTDVFSRLLVPRGKKATGEELRRREHWNQALTGRTLVIAAQTRAELLAWPLISGWGPERAAALQRTIAGMGVIPVDDQVQRSYAQLTAWARATGHGLHDKAHTGDRWIAASAVAFDLPLASDDKIFDAVEGLELLPRVAPGP